MRPISRFPGTRWLGVPRLILFLALVLCAAPAIGDGPPGKPQPIEAIDGAGHTIRLDRPAKRIIALYGAYNEILGAMGLESLLVAKTKTDMLPPSIKSLPSIGTHMRPNVELTLALKPDLILQGGGRRMAMVPVNQLRRQGLQVAVFQPESFEELFSVIERLGKLCGRPDAAKRLIEDMRSRLARIGAALDHAKKRPTVFFEVRYPNLLAAGTKSIVNDIIRLAGGENCVKVDKKLARMSLEAVIAAEPDTYVIQRGAMNPKPSPPRDRPNFGVLDAVAKGRILEVDEQVFSRPGPRSVEAVERLAAFLHPELKGLGR